MNSREALKELVKTLPLCPGVYIFKNKEQVPIYVGKAISLRSRVRSYFQSPGKLTAKTRALMSHVHSFEVIELEDEHQALLKENELIKLYQPHYNIMLRDDKTYPWVKVTMLDEFPRIYMTRKLDPDGSQYFGPYTNVGEARQVVEYVIETYKIRDCKKQIREGVLTDACISLQIGKCDGPCIDQISAKDYAKLVKKSIAFLKGQQKDIINRLKKEMLLASEQLKFELAAQKRDMIDAAHRMRRSMPKRQDDMPLVLQNIQKFLELSSLPRHIECFDISNIQGAESVASLVVFKEGKPSKRDYRKFKIKTVQGINDFAMMEEVITRRYSRLLREGKPMPDLLMVDGGKGQLSMAIKVVSELGLNLEMVGLAKKQELLFRPQRKIPVRLPQYGAELQLFQRIRDEAHRFAITFHRKLRDKRILDS